MIRQCINHALHNLGYRVLLGKIVFREQGIEHWGSDEMLRQHADSILFRDGIVEVSPQAFDKTVEFFSQARVSILNDCGNASYLYLGNPGHVLSPFVPISA